MGTVTEAKPQSNWWGLRNEKEKTTLFIHKSGKKQVLMDEGKFEISIYTDGVVTHFYEVREDNIIRVTMDKMLTIEAEDNISIKIGGKDE